MYCPKCGCKNRDGAKFCVECGSPMPQEGKPVGCAPTENITSASVITGSTEGTPSTGKLGDFLRKPVNFMGHIVPMFGVILAILLATAGIATAAFLIYRNSVDAQEQQQAQVVETKRPKKKQKTEQRVEETDNNDDKSQEKEKSGHKRTALNGDAVSSDSSENQIQNPSESSTTEQKEPPASNGQDQVTTPVPDAYDPATEAGAWTGQMEAFIHDYNRGGKSGSYTEAVLACGECHGAANYPLKLNIASVDATSRTASGTVSFLVHAHNGPIGMDISSDPGDTYIENIPFSGMSIDGWRSANMMNIYSGNGKEVQMSLRLKCGSGDDYVSVGEI